MTSLETQMTPNARTNHVSVANLSNYWYIACQSDELKRKPLAVTLLGTPMVLFRGRGGRASALLDRCPHRNIPLSLGQVLDNGNIECAYHGWQLDGTGLCQNVPGLCTDKVIPGRRAPSFPLIERDGFIWVYGTPDVEPETAPFALPHVSRAGYSTVVRSVDAEGTIHAVAENALDVPHTAYLHKGLFRGGDKNAIKARVKRWSDRVEAEYLGEPRPPGVAARLLSPSGGEVQHWDRFFLPSVAQVEYKLGVENHFLVTSVMTPISDFKTRLYAIISFKLRIPSRVILPILEPLAMRIFKQDADILKIQSEAIKQFGGENFMSTEIDVLGSHIWRLLKRAASGERVEFEEGDAPEFEREIDMLV